MPNAASSRADLLTLSFGTSVAMWALAYVFRLPFVAGPSWLLVPLMILCLAAGGYLAGRLTTRGARGGAQVGLFASLLNLLILGSLLGGEHPNQVVPRAPLFIGGALLLGAALGAVGALAARGRRGAWGGDWTSRYARVCLAATFLLLVAGGLVTSSDAGLAVVDWPNSFGYNMFLYPLSRMAGGIYYEHAHRLFGSLVGLATLSLAVHLWRAEARRRVRGLALAALALVIVQGILGGLRVTGHFTLATSPELTRPNLLLAAVHGVLGQVFFALLAAVAALVSSRWKGAESAPRSSAGTERALSALLVAALLLQLAFGALVRHFSLALVLHIAAGVFVALLAILAGLRAAALYPDLAPLKRLGVALAAIAPPQLLLGLGAMIFTLGEFSFPSRGLGIAFATAHQGAGAILLALATAHALWCRRLLNSGTAT